MNPIPVNDIDYMSLLDRIIKGAEFLENPIIKPEDHERGMKKYERLCEAARAYRKTDRQ